MLQGEVVQINVSPGGLPKRPIAEAYLSPLGFDGDAHAHPKIHGGPLKAVLLITAETTDELKARGFPVFYGALGENLTTRGMDRRQLRPGMQLRCGGAVIELTQLRRPCSSLDVYSPELRAILEPQGVEPGSAAYSMSGFYASVVQPGYVRTGDLIQVISVNV